MQHDDHDHDGKHGDQGRGGPEGTQFLDLEISRVLFGEAENLAREAVRDLLRESLRDRLRERLGTRLEALAHVAADALAEEVEANLGIESIIRDQSAKKRDIEERLRAALSLGEQPRRPHPSGGERAKPRRTR